MSEEQLKAFLEKVKADTSLQEKLKAAADADAVVSIAKAAGFVISADDLKKKSPNTPLSEEQLEGVAGGVAMLAGGVQTTYNLDSFCNEIRDLWGDNAPLGGCR